MMVEGCCSFVCGRGRTQNYVETAPTWSANWTAKVGWGER
jgi:hypothetical protein